LWAKSNTSIKAVCDFAHKYGSGKNLGDYPGDKTFAANLAARKTFSKLRAAIAGLYIWRMEHSADSDDRDRMYRAADLALRQSYAMCPSLPESVFRYANLLLSRRRPDDAILIAKTSLSLNPDDQQLQNLVSRLVQQY
jgi:predicted Zn-dependent protease